MFNYPATLQIEGFEIPSVVELAYLLYEGDYRKVIADAQDILLDYKEEYIFKPEKLRYIDYHIEGRVGKTVSPEIIRSICLGKYLCKKSRRKMSFESSQLPSSSK